MWFDRVPAAVALLVLSAACDEKTANAPLQKNMYSPAIMGESWFCRQILNFDENAVTLRRGHCYVDRESCEAVYPGAMIRPGHVVTECLEYPIAYCYAPSRDDLAAPLGWMCHMDITFCQQARADSIAHTGPDLWTECFPAAHPINR